MTKRIAYLVSGLVILSSGTYLFVYLYRWEWNRALIAGVIFIAAEIALAAMMILEKLRVMEQRIADASPQASTALEDIRSSAPLPRKPFRWLTGGDGDLSVFIPVLMGAGVIFSGIAWAIERFARITARPALEQGLALRLQPLALPEGGFLSPVDVPAPLPRSGHARFRFAFYTMLTAAALSFGVDALGDLTQNRPALDMITAPRATLTLEITREGWVRSEEDAAHSLWHACRQTVSPRFKASGFTQQGDGFVTMTITPAPGESTQRRLSGCLQDATLDNVMARIVGFEAVKGQ